MNSQVSKITRVPLREVWKHEAYDFTQWRQALPLRPASTMLLHRQLT